MIADGELHEYRAGEKGTNVLCCFFPLVVFLDILWLRYGADRGESLCYNSVITRSLTVSLPSHAASAHGTFSAAGGAAMPIPRYDS